MAARKAAYGTLINKLLQVPKRDKSKASYVGRVSAPNILHQADLLYLPTDPEGYKYCLVLVDVATRYTAALPLKRKDATIVAVGVKKIYDENKELKPPVTFQTDNGTEFVNVPKLDIMANTHFQYGTPGRHDAAQMAEVRNRDLTKEIMEMQLVRELAAGDGKYNTEWAQELPDFVKEINARLKRDPPPLLKPNKQGRTSGAMAPALNSTEAEILPIGSMVRLRLFEPRNSFGDKIARATQSRSGFRTADLRYEIKPREIVNLSIIPGQSPRYRLDGIPDKTFLRWEIQPVGGDETLPDPEKVKRKPVEKKEEDPKPEVKPEEPEPEKFTRSGRKIVKPKRYQ